MTGLFARNFTFIGTRRQGGRHESINIRKDEMCKVPSNSTARQGFDHLQQPAP
jgi:hypothetical protein